MDPRNRRHALALGATLALIFGTYYCFDSADGPDPAEVRAFLGTWTEEQGEPGNSIRFGLVRSPVSDRFPGIEVYGGVAVFRKHFGDGEVRAAWNYENHRRLRLNIVFPDRAIIAAVKVLDHDHLLVRFGADIEALSRDDVFESPDTKRLTRTAEGPR
jgi:hypothetical protein